MLKGRELEGRKVSQNVVKKFLVGQKLGKGVRACVCASRSVHPCGCMCVQFFGHGQNLASNV